jgi:hypothetical protein
MLPSVAKIWKLLFPHPIFDLTKTPLGATEFTVTSTNGSSSKYGRHYRNFGKAYWPISFTGFN